MQGIGLSRGRSLPAIRLMAVLAPWPWPVCLCSPRPWSPCPACRRRRASSTLVSSMLRPRSHRAHQELQSFAVTTSSTRPGMCLCVCAFMCSCVFVCVCVFVFGWLVVWLCCEIGFLEGCLKVRHGNDVHGMACAFCPKPFHFCC